MSRRLATLLVILALSTGSTIAYWLWPEPLTPLPKSAVDRLAGPLYIVRVEPVTDASIQSLVASLAPHLPIAVEATDRWSLDDRASLQWDEDLYDSRIIIEQLEDMTPPGTRVLGVTDQPMFDTGHWWLFGTAQLGGRTGIVSTAHLWVDDIPGRTADPLFRTRLSKVGVHEFGHTLSLIHCSKPKCVMYFSAEVSDLDAGTHSLCKNCLDSATAHRGVKLARAD